jgi:dTDP-4-dehydrorhamnose reductase
MNIFLTGASGLVGGAFAQIAAKKGHRVVGTIGSFTKEIEGVAKKDVLNLESVETLTAQVRTAEPQVIVNAAGVSEPAKCDADPIKSNALNVLLPAQLADIAQKIGVRFLHLSSEQVFDGSRSPYAVGDAVSPINLYGQQKVESEQRVQALAPRLSASVRLPLLMGNSPSGRRSLHERLFSDWSVGRAPKVYADEFRQTCTAQNVAEALLELCERPELCGVFHWAGRDRLSRVEQAERIRRHFQLSETLAPLTIIRRSDDPAAAAQRQADLALDLRPLEQELKTPIETFSEQLARLIVPSPFEGWYQANRTSS